MAQQPNTRHRQQRNKGTGNSFPDKMELYIPNAGLNTTKDELRKNIDQCGGRRGILYVKEQVSNYHGYVMYEDPQCAVSACALQKI